MSQPIFPIGTLVRVTGTFKSLANVLEDPQALTFSYRNPVTLTTTTLTYGTDAGLVRDSVGVFHVDVDTTPADGDWAVAFSATGSVQAASSDIFRVTPSRV